MSAVWMVLLCSLTYSLGVQAGGIFVNDAARRFISAQMNRAGIGESEALPEKEIEEGFGRAKKAFADPRTDVIKIRVGMGRMNLDSINVRRGILTLDGCGADVFYFAPSYLYPH
jgi:hypothetical protein